MIVQRGLPGQARHLAARSTMSTTKAATLSPEANPVT
jgi:hypothetical protein